MYDVSPDYIDDHVKKGTLRSVALKSAKGRGVRKPVRIPISELENLIEENSVSLSDLFEEAKSR